MNRNRFMQKKIVYGDKIFARITRNGETIYNFVSERVASITDMIMQLRKLMKGISGLVMVHIRNYNRGWGEERPLMLYTSPENQFPLHGLSTSIREFNTNQSQKMLFPWQTH